MSVITIGCDHRSHNIDGLNSLVDQHRSIATNVHRIATRRQSTNVLTNDQIEAPEVGQRRTTRKRTRSMRSCASEDGVGPSTSNHRPAFTGHGSSSYPDHMFSVSALESYHVPDQPFTGGASTSYSIPQYLSSGIAVADPFTSVPLYRNVEMFRKIVTYLNHYNKMIKFHSLHWRHMENFYLDRWICHF